jgi:cytidine deaminase
MAAAITNGEYKVSKIVAVWRDPKTGDLHVLPPCGTCREFMRQVDEANLDTEVVLGHGESLKLKELLPKYQWPTPLNR